jgi:rhodanese-related sulfurtransferase
MKFRLIVLIAIVALAVSPMFAQRGGPTNTTAKKTNADVLKQKLDKGDKVILIDVRREDEVQAGSVPGAVIIPDTDLPARMKDIPKDTEVVFICNAGNRSSRAAELFEKNDYKNVTYSPLNDWKSAGFKVEVPKKAPVGQVAPAVKK